MGDFLLVYVLLPAFHAGSFKLLVFSCNLFGSFIFLSRLGCDALYIWFVRCSLGGAHIGVGRFRKDQGKLFKLRRRWLGLSCFLPVCPLVCLAAIGRFDRAPALSFTPSVCTHGPCEVSGATRRLVWMFSFYRTDATWRQFKCSCDQCSGCRLSRTHGHALQMNVLSRCLLVQ